MSWDSELVEELHNLDNNYKFDRAALCYDILSKHINDEISVIAYTDLSYVAATDPYKYHRYCIFVVGIIKSVHYKNEILHYFEFEIPEQNEITKIFFDEIDQFTTSNKYPLSITCKDGISSEYFKRLIEDAYKQKF